MAPIKKLMEMMGVEIGEVFTIEFSEGPRNFQFVEKSWVPQIISLQKRYKRVWSDDLPTLVWLINQEQPPEIQSSRNLKRCPFCGSKAVGCRNTELDMDWHVKCYSCGSEGPFERTKDEAIEAWNNAKR